MNESAKLTHLDPSGAARMVDVGTKAISRRTAVATAKCHMLASTRQLIEGHQNPKGDVLQIARIAAISAAKRTDELIPLCHSVPLDASEVEFEWISECELLIRVTACATGRTGVEMEALVGVSLAALTIYDMCKSADRTMRIDNVQLESKSGGVRGDFSRNPESEQS